MELLFDVGGAALKFSIADFSDAVRDVGVALSADLFGFDVMFGLSRSTCC